MGDEQTETHFNSLEVLVVRCVFAGGEAFLQTHELQALHQVPETLQTCHRPIFTKIPKYVSNTF